MKKLVYLLPALCFIILTYSCKEETPDPGPAPDVMPTATTSGANTFGCMVDDELWVAKYADTTNTNITVNGTFDTAGGLFFITAVREDLTFGNFERINFYGSSIVQDPLQTPITYIMSVEHDKVYGYQDYQPETGGCGHYYHNMGGPGSITINFLDTVNQIISGNFDMNLVNSGCVPPNLLITEGVFDLKYDAP